jgi:hypothetical protein
VYKSNHSHSQPATSRSVDYSRTARGMAMHSRPHHPSSSSPRGNYPPPSASSSLRDTAAKLARIGLKDESRRFLSSSLRADPRSSSSGRSGSARKSLRRSRGAAAVYEDEVLAIKEAHRALKNKKAALQAEVDKHHRGVDIVNTQLRETQQAVDAEARMKGLVKINSAQQAGSYVSATHHRASKRRGGQQSKFALAEKILSAKLHLKAAKDQKKRLREKLSRTKREMRANDIEPWEAGEEGDEDSLKERLQAEVEGMQKQLDEQRTAFLEANMITAKKIQELAGAQETYQGQLQGLRAKARTLATDNREIADVRGALQAKIQVLLMRIKNQEKQK